MKNAKHTPGPWKVSESMAGKPLIVDQWHNGVAMPLENFADANKLNAALIAAAPDLLESLIWAVDILEHYFGENTARMADIQICKNQIAKATGEL